MEKFDKIKLLFIRAILMVAFVACTADISTPFEGIEANNLLNAGARKEWVRISKLENGVGQDISNCSENRTITFVNSTLDSIYVKSSAFDCASTVLPDTVYKATYELLTDDDNDYFENKIFLANETLKSLDSIRVLDITAKSLTLQYTEDEMEITETFRFSF